VSLQFVITLMILDISGDVIVAGGLIVTSVLLHFDVSLDSVLKLTFS